jgi:hypothetical protein
MHFVQIRVSDFDERNSYVPVSVLTVDEHFLKSTTLKMNIHYKGRAVGQCVNIKRGCISPDYVIQHY